MTRRKRTPEENERRAKILELLQAGYISSMDDIQNLFKGTIAEFMENGLDAELGDELGYSRYDYRGKYTDNSRNGHSSKTLRTGFWGDAKYHNAVFVGFDADGIARHAHKRGTYTQGEPFKGNVDGCDPRYSFHCTGQSDTVYVFEAPIDMLSFISLYQKNWQQHSYVSLCGVSEYALLQLLVENPQVKKVGLCLDNDKAGLKARERLTGILAEKGYGEVFSLLPTLKDMF